MTEKSKIVNKAVRFPHTYVLIFCIVIISALLTYIIPAGEYARVQDPNTGRTVVDPNSFTIVERNPVNLFDVLSAVPRGMIDAAQITFFIFIVAGSFQIITSTGAIEAGIYKVAYKLKGNEQLLIPIFMFLFSLTGAFLGFAEENIVFIPIAITLARALGYDAIVGMSLVSLGGAVGFNAGIMNPFTVGVAQGIAELPLFSGIGLRIIVWIVFLIVSILYVMRYAKKIKDKPELSIIAEVELEERKNNNFEVIEDRKLSTAHILVFLVLAAGLATIVFGVYKYEWYINEIAGIFLGMGIVCGFIGKMGPNKMAQEFVNGARGIVFGALVCGIARTILVVLKDGLILDSIIYYLSSLIKGLPTTIAAVGMLLIQSLINFAIPSGSGQAATTMPIMVPLADILGLTRQTAVLAFHFGDGFSNTFTPTASTLMASLSIAKIPYDKWIKYYGKLFFIWTGMGAVFMVIAVLINYGPF